MTNPRESARTLTSRSFKHFNELDFLLNLWNAALAVCMRQGQQRNNHQRLSVFLEVLDRHTPVVTKRLAR